MNVHYVRFKEVYEVRTIAPAIPWLVENRGLISVDDRFRNKSFLQSSISGFTAGLISINTLLSLWDSGQWKDNDMLTGKEWWVYKLIGDYYRLTDLKGNILTKKGSRLFLFQYIKHSKVNYEWGQVNVKQLKLLYDTSTGLFRL